MERMFNKENLKKNCIVVLITVIIMLIILWLLIKRCRYLSSLFPPQTNSICEMLRTSRPPNK